MCSTDVITNIIFNSYRTLQRPVFREEVADYLSVSAPSFFSLFVFYFCSVSYTGFLRPRRESCNNTVIITEQKLRVSQSLSLTQKIYLDNTYYVTVKNKRKTSSSPQLHFVELMMASHHHQNKMYDYFSSRLYNSNKYWKPVCISTKFKHTSSPLPLEFLKVLQTRAH